MAGLVVGRVTRRHPPAFLLSWSLLGLGMLTIAIGVARSIPVTLSAVALAGFVILFGVVSLNTLLQAGVPDEFRGRVFGAYLTVSALTSLAGTIAAGLLTDVVGSRVMIGGGVLDLAAGIVALTVLVPAIRL